MTDFQSAMELAYDIKVMLALGDMTTAGATT